jgi:uncharacterized protein
MQLSMVFAPILLKFGFTKEEIPGIWSTFSFSLALVIILIILYPDIKARHSAKRSSRSDAVIWCFIGVFLVFGANIVAALIEQKVFGIPAGSENTETIVQIAKITPLFMIAVAVVGPILEEIIFRKIIFGTLYKRFNFFIAALISGLTFAVVHIDFTHIFVYFVIALTFSFLYVKTNRLIVPIVAHVAMNSFVLLIQVVFADELIKMQENLEKAQFIFGGL